jgi:hypothetical protein
VQSLLNVRVSLFDVNASVLDIGFDAVNHFALIVNYTRKILENLINVVNVGFELVERLKLQIVKTKIADQPDVVHGVPASFVVVAPGSESVAKDRQSGADRETSISRPRL